MQSQESRSKSPEEQLSAAKAAFRTSLLQNDTLFSILGARLAKYGDIDASLPEFGLEPTLQRNEDDTSTVGLRINRSATNSDDLLTFRLATYDYLPLGRMNTKTGVMKVSPELEAALNSVEKDKSYALGVLETWQQGIREMGMHFKESFIINPLTGTFELEEAVKSYGYIHKAE
jgi:hypothetical protein